jgi:hypothetical protein
MLYLLFSTIIAGSLVMACKRFLEGRKGYGAAWLCCAAINAFCLARYLFFPPV